MKGKVYLVGAGPGDPELLTLKAHRILRAADVVLHDELVSQEILALGRASARIQNVGKRCGRKGVSQEEIHSLMVTCAREGRMVVRLKGGDPSVFGRGNEEMEALRACGIEFEIIPGVTAAMAAAASAQISLTDRRVASRLIFLTNHCSSGNDGRSAADSNSAGATYVVYMLGGDNVQLSQRLRAAGLDSDTPCVIVSRTSTPAEAVYATRVGDLAKAPSLSAPALLIAGEVAAEICRAREVGSKAEVWGAADEQESTMKF
jgi:uroporphyrin-III C-methyltransferase